MKTLRTIIFSASLFALAMMAVQPVLAATASLSPATGTMSGTFSVDVVVDTEGADLVGAEVDVAYSGPITFLDGTTGDAGCTPTISESSNTISILCMPAPGSPINGTRTITTLNFSTSGSGTATMTVTDIGGNIDSTQGGDYTISASSGGTTGDNLPAGSTLPETSISPSLIAGVIGFLFLGLGILFLASMPEEFTFQMFLKQKLQNVKRKRSKYEEKVLSSL